MRKITIDLDALRRYEIVTDWTDSLGIEYTKARSAKDGYLVLFSDLEELAEESK
jgi:hypothetical protein